MHTAHNDQATPRSVSVIGAIETPSQRLEASLVSDEEAARILGQAKRTLSIWRSTGRYNLPYVKLGRRVYYRISDIEAFIARRVRNGHNGADAR
jgi:predicted DNA-binding transcriptional regulator AlpA